MLSCIVFSVLLSSDLDSHWFWCRVCYRHVHPQEMVTGSSIYNILIVLHRVRQWGGREGGSRTHHQETASKRFLASKISCCANSRNVQDDMGKGNKPIREHSPRHMHENVDNLSYRFGFWRTFLPLVWSARFFYLGQKLHHMTVRSQLTYFSRVLRRICAKQRNWSLIFREGGSWQWPRSITRNVLGFGQFQRWGPFCLLIMGNRQNVMPLFHSAWDIELTKKTRSIPFCSRWVFRRISAYSGVA